MNSQPSYRGYRFPPEIISHAVRFYHRFTLSLRDIEDLMAERNVIVYYESIRQWCATFGLDYSRPYCQVDPVREIEAPSGPSGFQHAYVTSCH